MRKYYVVRVNRDNSDTHAAETARGALALAMPDRGSYVELGTVEAADAGAARLMRPVVWESTFRWMLEGTDA